MDPDENHQRLTSYILGCIALKHVVCRPGAVATAVFYIPVADDESLHVYYFIITQASSSWINATTIHAHIHANSSPPGQPLHAREPAKSYTATSGSLEDYLHSGLEALVDAPLALAPG